MTAQEFREEFNLRYNNALQGAPGLDTYEISSYLTLAQEQFVKQAYDITKDPTKSFELVEKSRRILNELVKDEKITSSISSGRGLVDESKLYELSNDVMYIVLETAKTASGKLIKVLPITHDEFMVSYNNPFRKPNRNKAWRVDLSKENSKTTVELVSIEDISTYNVRYISFPKPIIVESLSTADDVAGLGLTINGETEAQSCLLNEATHREIVNIAVENAVLDYRESSLQNRAQINSRV